MSTYFSHIIGSTDSEKCYKSWHFPADLASQAVAAINMAWRPWSLILRIRVGKVSMILILFLILFFTLILVLILFLGRTSNTGQNVQSSIWHPPSFRFLILIVFYRCHKSGITAVKPDLYPLSKKCIQRPVLHPEPILRLDLDRKPDIYQENCFQIPKYLNIKEIISEDTSTQHNIRK